MPNQYDSVRAQLVNRMAKHSSVVGVEALLENAVKYRDTEKIKTATSMLQNVLSTKTKSTGDAYLGQLRPEPCKPGDCQKGCFWLNWCELKESFDLLDSASKVLKESRRTVKL